MADKKTIAAAKFQFVGGVGSGRGDKIDWPLIVQASIIKSYLTEKDTKTAKVIFAEHLVMLNDERAKSGATPITELPKSYSNNNAGSLLHGMRGRFLKRCEKGDKDTLAVAAEYKIVEPISETPATE